jgi:hypothetical protein
VVDEVLFRGANLVVRESKYIQQYCDCYRTTSSFKGREKNVHVQQKLSAGEHGAHGLEALHVSISLYFFQFAL